jgi:beta-xylosidase
MTIPFITEFFKPEQTAEGYEKRPFMNPILPGGHNSPSCTTADETFFCATSSGLLFPGLPIYAPKDLSNWRLASYA